MANMGHICMGHTGKQKCKDSLLIMLAAGMLLCRIQVKMQLLAWLQLAAMSLIFGKLLFNLVWHKSLLLTGLAQPYCLSTACLVYLG